MFALLLVFDSAGHNILGLRLPSGASAEWWESEEKRGPPWDWLGNPN
jgi:hypothetical protein